MHILAIDYSILVTNYTLISSFYVMKPVWLNNVLNNMAYFMNPLLNNDKTPCMFWPRLSKKSDRQIWVNDDHIVHL